MNEADLPKFWYNINADIPVPPAPVLHPGTLEPVTPDFLGVLFPMELILQEISAERYIEIPEPVREIYKLYRPSPLIRARRLEKALDTPAHIYFKYEGGSAAGSHKPNTAIPQAFYNKISGTHAMATETGAGQWGSALAMACNFFDLDLEVYMVKISYQQKPYRRILMETYGAKVFANIDNCPTQFKSVRVLRGLHLGAAAQHRHAGGSNTKSVTNAAIGNMFARRSPSVLTAPVLFLRAIRRKPATAIAWPTKIAGHDARALPLKNAEPRWSS